MVLFDRKRDLLEKISRCDVLSTGCEMGTNLDYI